MDRECETPDNKCKSIDSNDLRIRHCAQPLLHPDEQMLTRCHFMSSGYVGSPSRQVRDSICSCGRPLGESVMRVIRSRPNRSATSHQAIQNMTAATLSSTRITNEAIIG